MLSLKPSSGWIWVPFARISVSLRRGRSAGKSKKSIVKNLLLSQIRRSAPKIFPSSSMTQLTSSMPSFRKAWNKKAPASRNAICNCEWWTMPITSVPMGAWVLWRLTRCSAWTSVLSTSNNGNSGGSNNSPSQTRIDSPQPSVMRSAPIKLASVALAGLINVSEGPVSHWMTTCWNVSVSPWITFLACTRITVLYSSMTLFGSMKAKWAMNFAAPMSTCEKAHKHWSGAATSPSKQLPALIEAGNFMVSGTDSSAACSKGCAKRAWFVYVECTKKPRNPFWASDCSVNPEDLQPQGQGPSATEYEWSDVGAFSKSPMRRRSFP